MMESSTNLNHQEDFHANSSSSIPPSFHWNQDLLLQNNTADNFIPMISTNGIIHSTVQDQLQEVEPFQWRTTDQEIMTSHHQVADLGFVFDPMGRGSFSVVFPTTNISDPNQLMTSSLSPSSCSNTPACVDIQALDLLALSRFGRTLCQPITMDHSMAYGIGQINESTQNKISHATIGGVTNDLAHKANGNSLEYKSSQSVTKKPRFESRRPSFTPLKVRKEKLGDRIAALQQLVAPFGKTDTASVLMEAIGYIKFLQDQVETLSVPYMRSSNTKKSRTSEDQRDQRLISKEGRDKTKQDLRSRGLCLVPLSCTSYLTNENGVWSPPNPNYRGGT